MKKLPSEISPCPIVEAIFEVRFNASFPSDAIFGVVYDKFKSEFHEVEQMPILQLPANVRAQDPNLKFKPHYKIKKDNYIMQIGPDVFSLIHLKDYTGWSNFSEKIFETYSKLDELKIIKDIERISLRYINMFSDINIFQKSNLKITLNNNDEVIEYPINLTTQVPHSSGISLLKLVNNAEVKAEGSFLKGSIIDIDTQNSSGNYENINDTIDQLHKAEKKLFYELLKDDYIKTLNPKYEE